MNDQKLYVREWTNIGMPKSLTWIFTTNTPNGVLGDAIGDIFATNHDGTMGFRLHRESYCSVVNVMNSTLYFYDLEDWLHDEESDQDECFVYFNHDCLARTFMNEINDLITYGKCECDLFINQMNQFINDNHLNVKFHSVYDNETYEHTLICELQ